LRRFVPVQIPLDPPLKKGDVNAARIKMHGVIRRFLPL
jgi:hypothetical protein